MNSHLAPEFPLSSFTSLGELFTSKALKRGWREADVIPLGELRTILEAVFAELTFVPLPTFPRTLYRPDSREMLNVRDQGEHDQAVQQGWQDEAPREAYLSLLDQLRAAEAEADTSGARAKAAAAKLAELKAELASWKG